MSKAIYYLFILHSYLSSISQELTVLWQHNHIYYRIKQLIINS